MAVHYDKLKLVWLSQNASNSTSVTWVYPSSNIGTLNGGHNVSMVFRARADNGPTPTYSLANGTLPSGLSLSNVGYLTGTVANSAGSYTFTIQATSGTQSVDRTFTANTVPNLPPVWNTMSGSLGSQYDNSTFTTQLSATDPEGATVNYSLAGGVLPGGLALHANGTLSGTLTPVPDDTQYFFTVQASDGISNANRAFNFTTMYDAAPTWVTPEGSIEANINLIEGYPFTYQLNAVSSQGHALSYSLYSGNLPGGISLSNSGLLSGTFTSIAYDTNYVFTVEVSDGNKAAIQAFSLYVQHNYPPNWVSSGQLASNLGGSAISVQLSAPDPNGSTVTFALANGSSLPGTLTLNSAGLISGNLPLVNAVTTYPFTVVASDGVNYAPRAFTVKTLVNEPPVWVTNATLNATFEQTEFSQYVNAVDPLGIQTITYQTNSDFPHDLSLNSTTGLISGLLPTVLANENLSFTITANNGILTTDQVFTLPVVFQTSPVWITPQGQLGNTTIAQFGFDYQLQGTDPDGASLTYSLTSGSLPQGIGLSSSGRLSGQPANVSNTTTYDFSVGISDSFNPTVSNSFSITITENFPAVWVTNSGSLGSAFETAPFTAQLDGYDLNGLPVVYYLMTGSELPDGLALNPSTGIISGSLPNVPNDETTTFTVAVDNLTPSYNGITHPGATGRTFSITTLFNSPPVWSTTSLPNGIEGTNYTYQLQATGVGNGPMVYTLNGGVLPSGITLSAAGTISGTLPAAANNTTYTFTVHAFNGIKGADQTLSLTDEHRLPPVWVTNSGLLGSYYGDNSFTIQLSATDANGLPLTYALENGTTLPNTLSLSSSGEISGYLPITTNATTYSFSVGVTDGVYTIPQNFSIQALAEAAPSITTSAGSLGTVLKNEFFTTTLAASDPQNLPITWSVLSGSLPSGITLNGSTGVISGNAPNISNNTTYTFTIEASNGTLNTSKVFSISVDSISAPVWNTPAGSLGSIESGYNGGFSVSATDPQGLSLTYALVSGSLPAGMTLSGNEVEGTVPVSNTTTTYNFTLSVSNADFTVDRSFSITTTPNLPPVWANAAGSLGTFNENETVSIQLYAPSPDGKTVLFTVVSGSLPSGLTLTSGGLIEGTTSEITNTTTSSFVIQANNGVVSATQDFSITVDFSTPPSWSTGSTLPNGIEQTPYTVTFVATSAGQAIEYTLNSGTLPVGLTLYSNGVLTGTLPPAVMDTEYSFTINAESEVSLKSTNQSFNLLVEHNQPPVWSTPSGNIYTNFANTTFSESLYASESLGLPVYYYMMNAAQLPAGVSFNPNGAGNTAIISGTLPVVTSDTTYPFTVSASDGAISVTRTFSITSWYNYAPIWTTNAGLIANVVSLFNYSNTVVAYDVHGQTITYSLANGSSLPGTGSINSSTGLISGTAPAYSNSGSNNYNFTINANNGTETTARTFSIDVTPHLPPVWVSNGSLGSVLEGSTFTATLVATDPEGLSLSYAIANGSLPPGLSLSGATISGRAGNVTANTVYSFGVVASDGATSTTQYLSIEVIFNSAYNDPFSNSVILLAPFMTSLSDVMGNYPVSNVNVVLDTSEAEFGNASAGLSGGNGYIYIPSNTYTALNPFFSSVPLTIDFWFRPSNITSESGVIFSSYSYNESLGSLNASYTLSQSGSTITFATYLAGNGTNSLTYTMPSNQWTHCALVFHGGTSYVYVYINGTSIGDTFTQYYPYYAKATTFGAQISDSGISNYWTGNIQNLRYTNAIRYSSNFTPGPTPIPPLWITNSATIYSGSENTSFSANVAATDPYSLGLNSYNIISNFPSWASLNANTGVISGTLPPATGNAFTFTLQAEDGYDNLTYFRSFGVYSNAPSSPNALQYSWRFNGPSNDANLNPVVGSLSVTPSNASYAAYTTAPSPYGSYNALYLSSSTSLTAPTGTSFSFLTGSSWTLEMWVYLSSSGDSSHNYTLFNVKSSTNGDYGFRIYCDGTNQWGFISDDMGISPGSNVYFPAPTASAWNHFALVNNNNVITAYMNGVAGNSVVASSAATTIFNNQTVTFNGLSDVSGFALPTVYFSTVNLWNVAKYDENFTPLWNNYEQPIWDATALANSVISGYQNAIVSASFKADTFGGRTYTLSANGVPSGFTFNSNGTLTGTIPTYIPNANAFAFTITAVDNTSVSSPPLLVTINSLSVAPIWTTNAALGSTYGGISYSTTLLAVSPVNATVTYSVANNSLPYGLSLNTSNGYISGTLNAVAQTVALNFTINAFGNGIASAKTFTLTEVAATPTWVSNANLGSTYGITYSQAVVATSPVNATVVYSVANGSSLPSGLSLAANGLISGSLAGVAQAVVYSFTLNATADAATAPQTFTLTELSSAPIWVSNASLGTVYTNVSQTVVATSPSNAAITYGVANGSSLPYGLSINANSGLISGTLNVVSQTTILSFTVNATADGVGASRAFNLTELSSAPVWVTNSTLPTASTTYSTSVYASSPSGASVTYSVANGSSLPYGLTLTGNTISGTLNAVSQTTVYNFTLNASVQTAATSQVFSLTEISFALGDNYSGNTVSLLHFDGNVTDYGNSSLTWSLVGSSTLSNTTSYFGNGSLHLQSSNGATISGIQSTPDSRFNLSGNTDFTFEMWVNVNSVPTGYSNGWLFSVGTNTSTNNSENLNFYFNGSTNITGIAIRAFNSSGTKFIDTGYNFATPLSFNTWHHYVAQRHNYTYYIFVDGTCVAQFYNNTALNYTTNAYVLLGSLNVTGFGYSFNGYMDEFRYTYGQARYSGNFTPAITQFGVGGPKWAASPAFLTAPSYTNTAVVNSSVYAFEQSPAGGSFTFNGNNSLISVANSAYFDFASTLTIELWIYVTSLSSTLAYGTMLAAFDNFASAAGTGIYVYSTGQVAVGINGVNELATATGVVGINQWTHLAVSRINTSTTTIFVNGIPLVSGTTTSGSGSVWYNPPSNSQNLTIGGIVGSPSFQGYITNFRMINGRTLYTGQFAPPTAPLTAVANTTILLTASSNATALVDSGPVGFTVNGTNVPWTTNSPYQQTQAYPYGSASFNGSNYLNVASSTSFAFGSSLTIEMWVYFNSLPNTPYIAAFNNGSTGSTIIYVYNTGQAAVGINGTNQITTGTGAVSTNKWTHIAVVRNGSTTTIYIDGVNQGSGTTSVWTTTPTSQNLSIGVPGAYINGYIAGFRMVNGTAVYTSNFTPSIFPPTAISGTTILLNFASNSTLLADSGPNNFTVTNVGAASWSSLTPFYYPYYPFSINYTANNLPPGLSLTTANAFATQGVQGNAGIISGTVVYSNTDAAYSVTLTAQDMGLSIYNPITFTYRTSGSHDTYYSNVVALVKATDVISNASLWNYASDFSQNNYSFTTTANAVTGLTSGFETTAQTKFANTTSLYFSGAGPVYSTAANPINLGSNNFTIEAWVYVQSLTSAASVFRGGIMSYVTLGNGGTGPTGYYWNLYLYGTTATNITGILFEAYNSSTNANLSSSAAMTPSINNWHHVAFVKNGSNLTFYLDGMGTAATSEAYTYAGNVSNAVLSIGGIPISSTISQYSANLTGYIQEARLTIGVARYTANFTPPTAPFPIS